MKVSKLIYSFILCTAIALFGMSEAVAAELSVRLSQFPHWEGKPNVSVAVGDLFYPEWFGGTWEMRSTLIDAIAPLAPDLITPGFESNRSYLNIPVSSKVRFIKARESPEKSKYLTLPQVAKKGEDRKSKLVADRAFNGLNLAIAYLGKDGVIEVDVEENNPNRQVTILPGNRQLISLVSGRKTETNNPHEFTATEIFQQIFKTPSQVYLNEVETTSAYRYQPDRKTAIAGEQVTAIYLSPQDPHYFPAKGKPVALYRYRLEFVPDRE